MNDIFEAYNFQVEKLVDFYRRLNQTVTYPDGMETSLGIVYWGEDKHLDDIETAIPILRELEIQKLSDLYEAIRTPARSRVFSERSNLSKGILRILKHDIALWLPRALPLDQFELFQEKTVYAESLTQIGIQDHLGVISFGQTPDQRESLSQKTGLDIPTAEMIVKYCDYYRTGKNLDHIRARLYYNMGFDTLQKWAHETSENIIQRFTTYIQDNPIEGERLIPWPKEVRNGIEWAKRHLEIYRVRW